MNPAANSGAKCAESVIPSLSRGEAHRICSIGSNPDVCWSLGRCLTAPPCQWKARVLWAADVSLDSDRCTGPQTAAPRPVSTAYLKFLKSVFRVRGEETQVTREAASSKRYPGSHTHLTGLLTKKQVMLPWVDLPRRYRSIREREDDQTAVKRRRHLSWISLSLTHIHTQKTNTESVTLHESGRSTMAAAEVQSSKLKTSGNVKRVAKKNCFFDLNKVIKLSSPFYSPVFSILLLYVRYGGVHEGES